MNDTLLLLEEQAWLTAARNEYFARLIDYVAACNERGESHEAGVRLAWSNLMEAKASVEMGQRAVRAAANNQDAKNFPA
jgi:hypothetical protein